MYTLSAWDGTSSSCGGSKSELHIYLSILLGFSPVQFQNVCFFHCEGVDRADLGGRYIGGVKWHWIAPTLSLHLFVDFHHENPNRLDFLLCVEP